MRFLITGIAGFAGAHLAALLLESGHSVFGLVRGRGTVANLDSLHERFPERFSRQSICVADVLNPGAVRRAVAELRPDGIFHLAAVTFGPEAAADPLAAYRTNIFGTLNVLTSVKEEQPACRVLYVGSGEAYGASGNAAPIVTEDMPLRPVSAYGVSKAAADLAAFQWHWNGGDLVRARPFNHTGPGQRSRFVCSDFARQIVEAELGARPAVLEVGNLDAERDFSDVRDIVAGYLALWERGAGGRAYNLCSGHGVSIRAIVDELCLRARVRTEIRVVAERCRPGEIHTLVGSFARAEKETGWKPRRPLGGLLDDLLDFWRAELGRRI